MNNEKLWSSYETIHKDLITTKKLVYDLCNFESSQPIKEEQNSEYGAYIFKLNDISIRFRVAKITPTKVGQFVTLWERIGEGAIQPYDVSDSVDLFVINTCKGNNLGQFVFPKSILCERDILSNEGIGGKRAMRVYPPWDKPTSRQAIKTQEWQLQYFLEIPLNTPINYERTKMLYNIDS